MGTDTIMDTGTHVLSWTKSLIMAKKIVSTTNPIRIGVRLVCMDHRHAI
jgi:hypothetical protein